MDSLLGAIPSLPTFSLPQTTNTEQLSKLDYRFDNNGVFWMTYSDMLGTFTNLYRTRLFDEKWTVIQEWTSVNVAWLTGYLQKKFVVEVKKSGTVVFVLQQVIN
jgi:hypothetical protein